MTQAADSASASPSLTCFTTSQGRTIYSFPIPVFTSLVANIYVVEEGIDLYLVDCGSGMPYSNQSLLEGFKALESEHHRSFAPESFKAILVTHGHIDHFGGLSFLRGLTHAPIGVHRLDQATLSQHEERVVVASRRLELFLEAAGVPEERRAELMEVYLFAKGFYRSVEVGFLLEEGVTAPGGIEVIHVPGHCPGQVCLQIDDVLLTADHVLSRTTPHQAPESITPGTGLGHYLDSLAKIEGLKGIRLALGGHESPMEDLGARIQAIRRLHDVRLDQILEICRQPLSVREISFELFGHVESYHVLLALEETGAHVEYLYQRGELAADNLDEIKAERRPVIRYRRV